MPCSARSRRSPRTASSPANPAATPASATAATTPTAGPFVFIEFLYGSWGGRPDRDGVDACSSSIVNFSNNPVEIIESEQPLLIERYGYVPDTGGAGEFRGGLAVVRDYRFELAPGADAQFLMRTDRRRFVPYGLAGGRPGTPSSNVLDPDGAGGTHPADEGPPHGPSRRPDPPPGRGRGRLGRSAGARSGAGPPRRARGEADRRVCATRIRRGDRRGDDDRGRRRDRAAAGGRDRENGEGVSAMRIGLYQMSQETDTFNPLLTTMEDFAAFGLETGPEMLERHRGPSTIGGYLAAVEASGRDVETVGLGHGLAVAGGRITTDALRFFEDRLRSGLAEAGHLDGLAMLLHGACSAEGVDDVEGRLLAIARAALPAGHARSSSPSTITRT